MITNYQELPIREEMKKAIAEMGFTEMTEIQQKAIPELLADKEVIAKAPTGTGKTCAFGVPMVQRIQPEKGYVQGVILCPTRELCLQITEELQKLGKYIPGFSIVAVWRAVHAAADQRPPEEPTDRGGYPRPSDGPYAPAQCRYRPHRDDRAG